MQFLEAMFRSLLKRYERPNHLILTRFQPGELSCCLIFEPFQRFLIAYLKPRAFIFLVFAVVAVAAPARGQRRQQPANFQGEWVWTIYAKSRDELPPAYRNENLKDVPAADINLTLKQKGNKLTGEYSASRRFLAKVEDGELDGVIRGKRTRLELVSGFEGSVTVLLTLQGNRLHWKTIKSQGEHYFPDDVYLKRMPRRTRRRQGAISRLIAILKKHRAG